MQFSSTIITLLAAVSMVSAAAVPIAQDQQSKDAAPSQTISATPSVVTVTSTPTPTAREAAEYYPPSSHSYDDSPMVGADDAEAVVTGGNDGKSDTFMGLGVPAQIGIISVIVIVALAMFGGTVAYYFKRKREWEREVQRRSVCLANAGRVQAQEAVKKAGLEEKVKKGSVGSSVHDGTDLEKGAEATTGTSTTVSSTFEGDTVKPSIWKKMFGGSK